MFDRYVEGVIFTTMFDVWVEFLMQLNQLYKCMCKYVFENVKVTSLAFSSVQLKITRCNIVLSILCFFGCNLSLFPGYKLFELQF